MSQIIKNLASGPVPPTVATSYVTNAGIAVPAANVLNVFGNDSSNTDTSVNNLAGITSKGSGNTVTYFLTNRITGTVTTTDATPTTLVSFALPTTGVYAFDFSISSFNTTDVLGASYKVFVGNRTNGATATKLNLEDKIVNEEAGNTGCNITTTTSGNNFIIQATGIAGKTINWVAVGTYVFAGP